ncbi:molecular chaperone HtpG [Pleomorphomonas carboxyditropha]|uniref:Chaperone protein HtpG n=1 Tax=Pleomorphomonas carboxyditropha TaxID=2023338 RepID=A0A2G9WQM7_9HYPH|nr:molecular chaperone HtpG [Pleomorphomonas carboxyditropha]
MSETMTQTERHSFEAEVSRLLHLMVHSVYSNKDIFLRELISNAADACEKLRYLAIAEPQLAGEGGFAITLSADKEKKTLVVADNGIGMSHDELKDNLGTIARSGTRAFLENLADKGEGQALIGQFGVGFYSAFMVADRVRVVSRRAGSDEAWAWESGGAGTFDLTPVDLAEAPARGTIVELHLNDSSLAYAEEHTLERIVHEYSAHVPVPIRLDKGEETRELADGSALWVKPKSAVTADEYKEFYHHVAMAWDEPALTLHYRAEGRQEYNVLLFVPREKPFDLFDPSRKGRVKLYVRRVFITDEAEILPAWLRFVRGVIDSEDLPLNMSREMLQKNPVIETIAKGVTGRVLGELSKLAETDAELFQKVWSSFGAVIKEGLYEAPERRDELFKVVRFKTTTSGDGWRSLADVVKDFKENQTAIYYALGEDEKQVLASPHLEGYAARGLEVLILTDPVDAFWVRTALGFEGKPFKSVTQGEADLDGVKPLDEDKADEPGAEVAGLVATLKEALKDDVADVRTSVRLATSPVCLVASDFGLDRMTEKLVARQEGKSALGKPVLELNAGHSLIKALAAKAAAGDTAAVTAAAPLLVGQARILDGEAPSDPAAFAASVATLLEKSLA